MPLTPPRWRKVTESEFPWERDALEYYILTGQAPATTPLDLAERLRRGGLLLTDVLDGSDPQLTELVREATAGTLSNRTQSVEDFIAGLDLWEEHAAAPDTTSINPADAHKGDELPGGFTVEKRLGKGATAVARLVRRGDERLVLKVALGPEFNERVREEGEILRKLHHQNIVGIRETMDVAGLNILVIDHAGDRTLARMLDEEGRLSLDFLDRFGDDLLGAVDYLEQQGIWHRDIKPANIGITPLGRGDKLHLVLFDFSLARTPVEQYRAGTPGYLDPFIQLRRPPQYDLHAERFAAAVTLYEMARGKQPSWGDGSDPAQLDCEVTLDTDSMDASLREPLATFFKRDLARNAAERFANAEDMRRAWAAVFAAAASAGVSPVVPTQTTDGSGDGDEIGRGFELDEVTIAAATLETPIDQLGLSVRAVNALERLGCSPLRDVLRTSVALVFAMRGVGHKTRREMGRAFDHYRQKFADADCRQVLQTPRRTQAAPPSTRCSPGCCRPASVRRATSPDWNNLQTLVARALPRLDDAMPRQGPPVLLTFPGLLARYERLAWIADLSQRAGHPDGLHGAWLLVPWEDPGVPASLDGKAIPVLPSQRAHIPDGWLANRHRAGLETAV